MYHKGIIVCSNPPFPRGDGGRTAIMQDIQSVIKHNTHFNWDIIVLWSDDVHLTAKWLDNQDGIHNYWIFDKPLTNPLNLLKSKPEHIERFVSPSVLKEVLNIIKKGNYNGVILNGIYSGALAPLLYNSKQQLIIYRSHNVEYILWQQVLNSQLLTCSQVPLSIYALNESLKYKAFEPMIWKQVHEVWSIGYHDTLVIKKENCNVKWILPQFYCESLENGITKKDDFIAFLLTSYNWFPNRLGLLFWLKKVFPYIAKSLSKWKFIIGGLGTEALGSFARENLEIVGWIHDIRKYFEESFVFFVPVWISSGVRIKIIEAALHGKVIVSTFEGIKGLPLVKWKHYIPVDASVHSWINAFKWVENNREEAKHIAATGRQYILNLMKNHNKPIIKL